MLYKGQEIPFPAVSQVSFFKVLQALEKQVETNDANAGFAKNLLNKALEYPELRTGIDRKSFNPKAEVVKELCATLFPELLLTNEIKGITAPFEFEPFYKSMRLRNIMDASDNDFSFDLNDFTANELYIFGCSAILSVFYRYHIPTTTPAGVDMINNKTGLTHTYRLAMNAELLEFIPLEQAVEIKTKDYQELLNNFDNIDYWKRKFPPDSWLIRGIMVINMMDITSGHSLASITSSLLKNTTDAAELLPGNLQKYFEIPKLSVGLILFSEGQMINPFLNGLRNFLLRDKDKMVARDSLCAQSFEQLVQNNKPLIITDVSRYHEENFSYASGILKEHNIGSYILAPVTNEQGCFGFLELASDKKYELNAALAEKLSNLLPIISMALSRKKSEEKNYREAIIQQECTSIHTSVKWRFEKEADKFIEKERLGEEAIFSDIIFENVYPLFGQMDIRSSTERRNIAVQQDMLEQLRLANNLLKDVTKNDNRLQFVELALRVQSLHEAVSAGLEAETEHLVSWFFKDEFHPVLQELPKDSDELQGLTTKYFENLDPELQSVYRQRKNYDETVNKVNMSLAALLDNRQEEAQEIFPHYFERYKTDGLEYNIYVGRSISKDKKFNIEYLYSLQLWQLIVTCEMEQKFRNIKTNFHSDLEITSLILVYNTTLSIQFRTDEKRFDVGGAYNARYEIMKKRIDKSFIKGTAKRITQPGKIAIIYSSDEDAVLYRSYISFLENKKFLVIGSTELLLVEDLPGIKGLKAMRVELCYNVVAPEQPGNISEILKEFVIDNSKTES